jgi:hypothetical protein
VVCDQRLALVATATTPSGARAQPIDDVERMLASIELH